MLFLLGMALAHESRVQVLVLDSILGQYVSFEFLQPIHLLLFHVLSSSMLEKDKPEKTTFARLSPIFSASEKGVQI